MTFTKLVVKTFSRWMLEIRQVDCVIIETDQRKQEILCSLIHLMLKISIKPVNARTVWNKTARKKIFSTVHTIGMVERKWIVYEKNSVGMGTYKTTSPTT